MMKRGLLIGLSCILLLSCTGCGGKMPDATEEQMDAIAEYAAVSLLKYDANQRSRLVEDAVVEEYDKRQEKIRESIAKEEREKAEKEKPKKESISDASGETTVIVPAHYDKLEDVLQVPEGVTVLYEGEKVVASYPEGQEAETLSVEATEGKKLLVLKFLITNGTAEKVDLNFNGLKYSCKITINDSASKGSLPALLLDDLLTYRGSIDAGANEHLVIITEMDDDDLQSIESVRIRFKSVENEYTIQTK